MELKSNFNPLTATAAHENTILAAPVLPKDMPAPFDHAWGYLDKPGEMEYHKHPMEEIYFFFKGEGFVRIDGEEIPVKLDKNGNLKLTLERNAFALIRSK